MTVRRFSMLRVIFEIILSMLVVYGLFMLPAVLGDSANRNKTKRKEKRSGGRRDKKRNKQRGGRNDDA